MTELELKPFYKELFESNKSDQDKFLVVIGDATSHFNRTNRCESAGTCRYSPKTIGIEDSSEGCLVGRMFTEESQLILDQECAGNSWGNVVEKAKTKNIKLPKFMVDNFDFFSELQLLHDHARYWDYNGLSIDGRERLAVIKKQFLD